MARALTLGMLGLAACYRPLPYTEDHAADLWRTTMASAAQTDPGTAAPSPGAALGPDETFELAVRNSPSLAVLDARAAVAEAEVGAAKQLDNPQLRLTSFDIDDVVADQPELNVAIRMPIPRPGETRARAAAAKHAAEGERSWTDDAKRKLRRRIDRRFAELAALHADLDHTQRSVALATTRRDHINERLDAAVATRLDLAVAEVGVAEAKAEQGRIDAEITRVEGELRRLAGVRGPLHFTADRGLLEVVDLRLERDALVDQALRARPELRAHHARVGRARAETALARNAAWPWFDWAQAQYRAGPNSTAASWGFGVAITLPALSLNRGEIRAAKSRVRQREAEQWAEIATIASEVDEAMAEVDRTARRVHELQTELLPPSEAAVREATAALEAGSIDPLLASDVEVRAVAVRRLLVLAQLEHRHAVIELQAAVGGPLHRHGG